MSAPGQNKAILRWGRNISFWLRLSIRDRPAGWVGLALIGTEASLAAIGLNSGLLAIAVLVGALGLVALPLLPARFLERRIAALAAVPAIGFAISIVLLVTVSTLGIGVTPTGVRLALIIAALALLLLPLGDEPDWSFPSRDELVAIAGLGLALALGMSLQGLVLGDSLVPGNDWAKYLLYADTIKSEGKLLVDNPYWMLGVPFRDDPGVPSLYAAYLLMTSESAGVLVHGIWLFAIVGVLSTFAYVAVISNYAAASIAAGIWAAVPINHDILAWHGLANVASLALLPLVLLLLTVLLLDGLTARSAAILALMLIAVAAVHRLSLMIALTIVVLVFLVAMALPWRSRAFRAAFCVTAWCALLGLGVAYDLWQRNRTFGGTQSYTSYLSTKLDYGALVGSLTPLLAAIAVGALGYLVWRFVRLCDAVAIPLLVTAGVVSTLAHAWIAHAPLVYFRMAYFMPLVIAPAVALLIVRLARPPWPALAGVALVVALAISAVGPAQNTRDFYRFANPASLRGLELVAARVEPKDVVLTDRCWSFLGMWLLQQPTLSALAPEDIQPAAEVEPARLARKMIRGGSAGKRLAHRAGVRWVLVDPECTDARGRPFSPPGIGRPIYASERLLVLTTD